MATPTEGPVVPGRDLLGHESVMILTLRKIITLQRSPLMNEMLAAISDGSVASGVARLAES